MKNKPTTCQQTSTGSRETYEITTLAQLKASSKYATVLKALYGGWVHKGHSQDRFNLTFITNFYTEIKPTVIHELYRQERDFIPKDNAGFGCGSDGYKVSIGNLAKLVI